MGLVLSSCECASTAGPDRPLQLTRGATEDNIIPPETQREMAARLGVAPIEIASDHAVFALQPRELAAMLVGGRHVFAEFTSSPS